MNTRKTDSIAALAVELNSFGGKLRRRLREQSATGDLTPTQTSVLAHLDRIGSATVTELARAEYVRPQSMGATIAVLETAGLVKGSPDPKDGRQTLLSLTAAGRELIRHGRAVRQDCLLQAIQTRLTPKEQEHLAACMNILNRLVDPDVS